MRNKRQSILSQHRQRGAVAVFVGIAILALLTGLMLAIETGRLYSTHRQLQKAATLAALDAARLVSGCTTATPTQASLNSQVNSSLVANGFDTSTGVTALTETGTIQTINTGGISQRSLLPAGIASSNAVRVTLAAPFPAQIIPLFQTGGTMHVSATATQDALGSLRVGSGLASLSGGLVNSLLSGLLGGNVNLTALDYNGLANVNITVAQLATALGVSVTDLSNLTTLNKTVALNTTLSGLTSALSGSVNSTVINALQGLAGQANNNPVLLNNILGPIGNIASDVPVVNLGDLIMALALASQSDSSGVKSIELKNVPNISVPGVINTSVFAKVLQPPQLSGLGRPGVTKASTAQITLMIRIEAGNLLNGLVTSINNLLTGLLNGLGGVLGLKVAITAASPPINIGVDVSVAPAVATLDRIDCPRSGVNNGQPTAGLSVNTAVANVSLGTFAGSASSAPPLNTSTTAWNVATVDLDASSTCVGLSLFGVCVGIPLNLGKTNLKVGLALTGVGVSNTSRTLNDVYQFTTIPTTIYGAKPVYRANGAPGLPTVPVASPVNENPQTVGSATSVNLNLGLTTSQTGSGLVGALGGLVSSLVSSVTSLLQGLLTIVNGLVGALINPLLAALGLQTGTATTTMDLVTTGQPTIVTTALP